MFRQSICAAVLAVAAAQVVVSAPVRAENFYLTEHGMQPGTLLQANDGTVARARHQRHTSANPAFPNAVMALSQVAVDVEGHVYFCSGLDRYVMQLLDGRNEVLVIEAEEQIRDVACNQDAQTFYYSVLATPQSGQPLPDGIIYRRYLGDARPTVVATVRQADIGGNWWGTFTAIDGVLYLATNEPDSRIFKNSGGVVTHIGTARGFRISGLSCTTAGTFHFTTNSGKVYRTTNDFSVIEPALVTDLQLRDVVTRPVTAPRAARPSR